MTCKCNHPDCQWCGEFSQRGRGSGRFLVLGVVVYLAGIAWVLWLWL